MRQIVRAYNLADPIADAVIDSLQAEFAIIPKDRIGRLQYAQQVDEYIVQNEKTLGLEEYIRGCAVRGIANEMQKAGAITMTRSGPEPQQWPPHHRFRFEANVILPKKKEGE